MTDDKKIVHLTKVVTKAESEASYIDVLKAHLKELEGQEAAKTPCEAVIICALTEDGSMHSVVKGRCIAQAIGLLEITKTNIYDDFLEYTE